MVTGSDLRTSQFYPFHETSAYDASFGKPLAVTVITAPSLETEL